jgi:hypothetical protein
MGHDGLWQRIRWGNVARLAGLVALALVVAAWPRLRSGPPRLPPATAVPLAGAGGPERPRLARPKARSQKQRDRAGERPQAERVGESRVVGERARKRARPARRPRDGAGARGGDAERARSGGAATHTGGRGSGPDAVKPTGGGGSAPEAGEPTSEGGSGPAPAKPVGGGEPGARERPTKVDKPARAPKQTSAKKPPNSDPAAAEFGLP